MSNLSTHEHTQNPMNDEIEIKITEFELQLWRVFYGFLRWQEECEKSMNNTFLSGNELAILHIVKLKNKSKTLIDIERLLNRDDTHNIRYSLKKLLQLGLIKKTLSTHSGKNHFYEITELGIKDTDNFLKMRKSILVNMFQEANLDLDQMTKYLTKIKTIYDEADRFVAQHSVYSEDGNGLKYQNNIQLRGRILVVEDHPTAAKITNKILTDLNYHVDIASSGDMALSLIQQNPYDIILMDIGLPDMDGCEITRKIRTEKELGHSFTPIIGLTVQVGDTEKRNCIESGMNAVFTKPLIKEKVADIFSMFVLKNNENKSRNVPVKQPKKTSNLPLLKGEIIDLSLGSQLVGGNETLAKEAIVMLVDSLAEELSKLESMCRNYDIVNVETAIHKLRGGISYCGVPRLNEACAYFDEYLKTGKIDLMPEYFNLLLFEVNQLKNLMSEMENVPV